MTADLLIECLNNPSRLFQLSSTELRSLAVQYPYAQNLHLLAWQKSLQEDKRDANKLLEKAAAYSPNRRLLLQMWLEHRQKDTPEPGWLLNDEEVLELKALSSLIPQPIDVNPAPEQEQYAERSFELSPESSRPASGFLPVINEESEEDDLSFDNIPAALADAPVPTAPPASMPEIPSTHAIALDAAALAGIVSRFINPIQEPMPVLPPIPDTSAEVAHLPVEPQPMHTHPANDWQTPQAATAPRPMGKQHFASWRSKHPDTLAKIPKNEAPPPDTEVEAATIAKKSVLENDHLATATLADLLARQGQNEKAIKMYERLSLKFPEKSTYFAAKIEQLKNT